MKIELQHAFETLGVPASASTSDVRTAYRALIRAHHPDHVAGDRSEANDRLAEINAAKDLIDRCPTLVRERPRRPAPDRAARPREDAPQQTGFQDRTRREAEARAFRKTMEARANAETEAERRARWAAQERSKELDRNEAAKHADEEARRHRQAAFVAAVQGQASARAPTSFLDRLRGLGSR